jgi:hypothetical protein
MTAALEGDEWSAARPDHTLHPGKSRYPFYRRLGGPQGRSAGAENLVPTGILSRTVQSVAQSPYRLSYPAHFTSSAHMNMQHRFVMVKVVIARSVRDGTCAETRFGLSAKRTSPFKLAGESVQSTAGSRVERIRR